MVRGKHRQSRDLIRFVRWKRERETGEVFIACNKYIETHWRRLALVARRSRTDDSSVVPDSA